MGNYSNKKYSPYGFINRLSDIFILNILWMVFSLPVFTMGASTTALYYVILKMVKNEDDNIIKSFLHSFKQNFMQGTIIWLLYLVFGGILLTVYNYLSNIDSFSLLLKGIVIIAAVFLLFSILYTFPILARYYNSIGRTMLNSFMISLRYIKKSLGMFAVIVILGIIGFYSKIALFFILLFGAGIFAYVVAIHFVSIFENIEKMQEELQASSEMEENSEMED